MSKKDENRRRIPKMLWVVVVCSVAMMTLLTAYHFFVPSANSTSQKTNEIIPDSVKYNQLSEKQKDSIRKVDSAYIKAITSDNDSSDNVIRLSSPDDLNASATYTIDKNAGSTGVKRIYNGRRINIAVIGVDSRLGGGCKHADANHVISILIDKGIVEITSIPRDTPADAGMSDSSGQNKLTIVYSNLGQSAYFKEAARIAGVDKIHYYIEVGFSQVIGILELLGYKDSHSTLQILRNRKGLGGDDYQRCYNQGQFIRQTLINHSKKFSGIFGDIFLRGALALVNTNISYDKAKEILRKLNVDSFPKSPDHVIVRVRPPIKIDYKIYDFNDPLVMRSLKKKVENYYMSEAEVDTNGKPVKTGFNPAPRLWGAINRSVKDTAKFSPRVIQHLKNYYDQRAWLQVTNLNDRVKIRDQIGILLSYAYDKTKKPQKAKEVRDAIENEKKLFAVPK